MAIVVACEGCGKRWKAPDHYAGRKARCTQCGNAIMVGASPPVPSSPTDARGRREATGLSKQAPGKEATPPEDRPKKQKKKQPKQDEPERDEPEFAIPNWMWWA